ncbi:hypothetical protein [Symbiopectobacterium purcellii]|uniref:hypothetical protein n=1 Tax=Symbiopectobacterium purcellii TaxID=2871826 RepID=UPI003F86171F
MTNLYLTAANKAASLERGVAFQSKSKLVAKLAADGRLEHRKESQQSAWGLMTWEHYALTHAGRIAYCKSCDDAGGDNV